MGQRRKEEKHNWGLQTFVSFWCLFLLFWPIAAGFIWMAQSQATCLKVFWSTPFCTNTEVHGSVVWFPSHPSLGGPRVLLRTKEAVDCFNAPSCKSLKVSESSGTLRDRSWTFEKQKKFQFSKILKVIREISSGKTDFASPLATCSSGHLQLRSHPTPLGGTNAHGIENNFTGTFWFFVPREVRLHVSTPTLKKVFLFLQMIFPIYSSLLHESDLVLPWKHAKHQTWPIELCFLSLEIYAIHSG